jgi:hypothetical protein
MGPRTDGPTAQSFLRTDVEAQSTAIVAASDPAMAARVDPVETTTVTDVINAEVAKLNGTDPDVRTVKDLINGEANNIAGAALDGTNTVTKQTLVDAGKGAQDDLAGIVDGGKKRTGQADGTAGSGLIPDARLPQPPQGAEAAQVQGVATVASGNALGVDAHPRATWREQIVEQVLHSQEGATVDSIEKEVVAKSGINLDIAKTKAEIKLLSASLANATKPSEKAALQSDLDQLSDTMQTLRAKRDTLAEQIEKDTTWVLEQGQENPDDWKFLNYQRNENRTTERAALQSDIKESQNALTVVNIALGQTTDPDLTASLQQKSQELQQTITDDQAKLANFPLPEDPPPQASISPSGVKRLS